MAVRGSKPAPTVLKLVRGNPGKRPLPQREVMAPGKPVKPPYLQGRSAELWKELIERSPWLASADSHKAAYWCVLQARLEELGAGALPGLITQWRILGSELGLDPTARVRMPPGDEPSADDPAARYFDTPREFLG